MDPRGRKRITWALLALVLLASSLGAVALMRSTVQSGPIVIDPGVILRPSQAWVDVGFASQQSFSNQVSVRATGVTLDNVSIDVQKLPVGLPRATMTITMWAPTASNGTTAIEFVVASSANSTVSFNVTGLRPDLTYETSADGSLVVAVGTAGGASFSWSDWLSSHTFDVAAFRSSPLPDTTPPAPITDLHAVAWGPDSATLSWTAPGNDGNAGQASQYEFRYGLGGTYNATGFVNGTRIPTSAPRLAGGAETLNVTGLAANTTYWFALRTADGIPNWSPISNVVAVQTLVTWVGVPSINSVSLDAPNSQVEIVFSEPMNQTSVEQSLNITPAVPYQVQWQDNSHVTVMIPAAMATNATYVLQVNPYATDADGTPMARTFTFQFNGLARPSEPSGLLGLPSFLLAPLLTVLAGLAVTTTVTAIWYRQTRRKARLLQAAVRALTRYTAEVSRAGPYRELRERVFPSRESSRRTAPGRGKK